MLVIDPSRNRAERLAGDHLFVYPRAAVDRHGTVHVVWAEPDSPPVSYPYSVRDFGQLRLTSVWHASYRDGRWSDASQIYQTRRIDWHPGGVSFVSSDSLSLHLAVVNGDVTKDGGTIVHLQLVDGAWRANHLQATGVPVYADMAADNSGRLAISYVAGQREPSESESAVFLVRSLDRGKTWGPHHVVTRPEQSPAYESKVVIGRDGTLHVLWMKHAPRQLDPEAVWHASSVDGGTTWESYSSTPVSALVVRSQVALDRCGTLHYVVERHHDRRVELAYARLQGGKWTEWQRPFEGEVGAMPAMQYDGKDHIVLVWESVRGSQLLATDNPMPIKTLRSSLTLGTN